MTEGAQKTIQTQWELNIRKVLEEIPASLSGTEAFHDYLKGVPLASSPSQRDQWGQWYESQLSLTERRMKGQHFTPDALCDLMLALTVENGSELILEPGCGTGAFLLRAYEQLGMLPPKEPSHRQRLSQLWGIELDLKAGFLSACQLISQQGQTSEKRVLPHIRLGDFLSVDVHSVPNFDVIIGNPPYIRQEHLKQQERFSFELATKQVRQDYTNYLNRYPEQEKLFRGHSDLYLWFFLKATCLLKAGGRLAFVTSNAWLTSSYGNAFRQFLTHHFELKALIESDQECWFPNAAINPVITVLRRRSEKNKDQPGRLIRLRQPLAQLLPTVSKQKTNQAKVEYWRACQSLGKLLLEGLPLNGVSNETMIMPPTLPETESSMKSIQESPWQSWMFQLKTLNQTRFLFEPHPTLSTKRENSRWLSLEDFGRVRYPLKTGINRFFYVNSETIRHFGIESEFLFPVLKSTKEITHLSQNSTGFSTLLFSCSLSLAELKKRKKYGALSYIQWGSKQQSGVRQKRQQPVYWPDIPSVQGRPFWYQCQPLTPAHLLCPRFFDRRFFFTQPLDELSEDQTFYGVTLHQKNPTFQDTDWLAARLNSTLSYFLVEHLGRGNLGDGVLQYARQDMARLPVLNPNLYSSKEKQSILDVYAVMKQRPIEQIEKEVLNADRRELDQQLLKPFTQAGKTTVDEIRERLVSLLLEQVQHRTER